MNVVIITGSGGLIGGDTARFFANKGMEVIGVDNDLRSVFFGDKASTKKNHEALEKELSGYTHVDADIRDEKAMSALFKRHGKNIACIVHAAAQPSHDWAANDPHMDFTINANGTLNLLELMRQYSPEAAFVFLSTNKVYGDAPNHLKLVEQETRWELDPDNTWAEHGIDESMSIDGCMHSLFGASKAAADLMVQEYGRYFGLKTACLRCGCLTGGSHAGAELHGFLSYLVKCAVNNRPYTVFGYKGKQVRDNLHSRDMASLIWAIFQTPRQAGVYNIGGSRHSNCSILEAIVHCEKRTGRSMNWAYSDDSRAGDHIWWISDIRRFQSHYPDWRYTYDIDAIMDELFDAESS
jgi:CDP-paratose 2-epimerase